MIALIDSDYMLYRACFGLAGQPLDYILSEVDSHIRWIIKRTGADTAKLFLTGPESWRKDKYPDYKGNRTQPKPEWFYEVQQHLIEEWNAEFAKEGYEADDAVATAYYQCAIGETSIIVAVDKDLNTVLGWHFNPKKDVKYYVYYEDARLFLWCQMLMGDTADNIPGLPNWGPVLTVNLLWNCTDPQLRVEYAYRYHYGKHWEEFFTKNLELLSLGY